jgi:hypothetical protein
LEKTRLLALKVGFFGHGDAEMGEAVASVVDKSSELIGGSNRPLGKPLMAINRAG